MGQFWTAWADFLPVLIGPNYTHKIGPGFISPQSQNGQKIKTFENIYLKFFRPLNFWKQYIPSWFWPSKNKKFDPAQARLTARLKTMSCRFEFCCLINSKWKMKCYLPNFIKLVSGVFKIRFELFSPITIAFWQHKSCMLYLKNHLSQFHFVRFKLLLFEFIK